MGVVKIGVSVNVVCDIVQKNGDQYVKRNCCVCGPVIVGPQPVVYPVCAATVARKSAQEPPARQAGVRPSPDAILIIRSLTLNAMTVAPWESESCAL